MASRRFFGYDYDPYDYYYTSPYDYSYPYYHTPAAAFPDFDTMEPAVRHPSPDSYYHHRPTSARARGPARNGGAFFRDAESPEPVIREYLHPRPRSSRSVSVPVQFAGSELEPEPKTAAVPKKRAPSAEEAAVTVQAAARGFLARRMVREVRAVEREAEAVAAKVVAEAEALRVDSRRRIGVGEELMRLVLRLDAVRGAREYRKKVTRKVLALQDAVDALEAKPAQAVTGTPASAESLAPELPQSGEQGAQIGADIAADSSAIETTADEMDMEVDGGRAGEADSVARAEEADSEATETIAPELVMADEETAQAEGEWEMVTGDDAFAGENPPPKAQHQEGAGEETEKKKIESATADSLDTKKVMEMVAALCERSAQQCALIGALAERVDTLERAVRRVEEADRRRRRNKKINKEGKVARSFYSD
uniref:Uncharacterized protein n=1 Tax=Avena sativa TaxID=4498 RepID=A0ACD5YQ57_AVESA